MGCNLSANSATYSSSHKLLLVSISSLQQRMNKDRCFRECLVTKWDHKGGVFSYTHMAAGGRCLEAMVLTLELAGKSSLVWGQKPWWAGPHTGIADLGVLLGEAGACFPLSCRVMLLHEGLAFYIKELENLLLVLKWLSYTSRVDLIPTITAQLNFQSEGWDARRRGDGEEPEWSFGRVIYM